MYVGGGIGAGGRVLIAVGGGTGCRSQLLVPESPARDALLCSVALPALCFCINLFCSHEQQWRTEYGQGRWSGQPAKRPICQLQPIPTLFHTFLCPEHFLVAGSPSAFAINTTLFSGEGNGGSLEFAMPPLRGKDESDVAVAAAAGFHSGRLRAEADGAAPWLHGGGSQRGDPGPGPARVGLPLPVHLLPLPAAPRYWAVCQWPRSPEGTVCCSWSSLPFPC